MRIGAIELGGTKTICAVFDGESLLDKTQFKTVEPAGTVNSISSFFEGTSIDAVGIASFGPMCLDPSSEQLGHIYDTVKPGWSNYDVLGNIEKTLGVPAFIDTDVNVACLGEVGYGVCRGMSQAAYITVGTGIGVGIVLDSKPYHGTMHPEAGHTFVGKVDGDSFEGICPFHGDCVEGLACGPAISKRTGLDPDIIPSDSSAWVVESKYIARLCYNLALTLSPEAIVIGGGVMKKNFLYDMIRVEFSQMNRSYLKCGDVLRPEKYILEPGLNGDQALYGCLKLVFDHLKCNRSTR